MPIPDFLNFNNAGPQQRPADGDTRPDFVDQDAMSVRLAERAADWVPMLFPNGRRDDDRHWRVANIRGDPPRKSGSCIIYTHGDRAGSWHEFDGGDGGGPLGTIARRLGLSGAELFAKAKELAGMPSSKSPKHTLAKPKADHGTEIDHIFRWCVPIAGTLAETYLRARGITAPIDCADLLFNPNCTHWQTKRATPALIVRLRYPGAGEPTGGLQRTYLADDGSKRIDKKMALGDFAGSIVKLAEISLDGGIGIAEGVENGLSAMQLFGLPVWVTPGTENMSALGDFIAKHGAGPIRQLEIFADRGKGGEAAAQDLARCAVKAGIEVLIRLPASSGDWNDDLMKGLPPSTQTLPIDMQEPPPQLNRGGRPATTNERPDDPAAALRGAMASKVPIRVDGGMLPYAARMGAENIVAASLPVYQRVDQLVRIAKGAITVAIAHEKKTIEATRALPIGNVMMRSFLNEACPWEKYSATAKACVPTNVTEDIAQLVLESAGDWPFRPLTGIIHTPVILRDDTLLLTRGYHAGTGLYYDPGDTEFPGLVAEPTKDDALAAVKALTHPIREIPFPKIDGKTDFSVALSAILSIVHRHALGFVPAHLFNAVAARTGKGLVSNYVSIIATGSPAPAIMATQNPEETEKSVVAMLRSGATLISIDNLVHPIGESGVINQILTEPVLNPRVLGKTEIFTAKNQHVILINGNQVRIEDDLVPKVLHARLDAGIEHPELREFESEFPLDVARRERGSLVVAALTILLWHRQCGCPGHGGSALGGFEDWDREIRSALIALDVGDPIAGQKALAGNDRKRSDNEKLLHAWFAETEKQRRDDGTVIADRTAPLTAKALAALADEVLPAYPMDAEKTVWHPATQRCPALHDIALELFDDKRGHVSALRMGSALGRIKDQVFGGYRAEQAGGDANRVMTWIVRRIGE